MKAFAAVHGGCLPHVVVVQGGFVACLLVEAPRQVPPRNEYLTSNSPTTTGGLR
jgi:hypothetical protein